MVKWALWLFGAILAAILLLTLLLILLPQFVSTQWTRNKVEMYASRAINRSIQVQDLSWTWDKGILLEGLEIDDDPSFSEKPIISLKRFFLSVNFRQLLKQRLVVLVDLEDAHLNLIKKKDGLTNLESLLSAIKPSPESHPEPEQKNSTAEPILPSQVHDIQARLNVNNVTLKIDDREQNRIFLIHDASFLLDVPSLIHEPIDLSFSAREKMDGNPLPPILLTAKIMDLINKDICLDINGLSAKIKGNLPGMEISLTGSVSRKGVLAKFGLDLEPLQKGLAPFISPPPPIMSGRIDIEMAASLDGADSEDRIAYDLKIAGHKLMVSGGPLEGKEIGPLDFLVLNEGILQPKEGMLDIRAGVIQVQKGSTVSFKGAIHGLKNPPITADLLADSISLHLQELFFLAGAFVPAGVSLDNGKEQKDRQAKLVIRNAAWSGTVPTGASDLKWDSLELVLPLAKARLSTGTATGEGLNVKVGKGEIAMSSFFPIRAELTADLGLDAFHLKGKDEISLKRLRIPRFHLLADNLSPSQKALLGVTGKIDLTESLSLEHFSASEKITVSKLLQTLNIKLTLPPSPSLHATIVQPLPLRLHPSP